MAIDKSSKDPDNLQSEGLSVPPDDNQKEEDEVKRWQGILTRTEGWRTQLFEKMGLPRFVKEYKGEWDLLQQNLDIPLIPINLVFAYVKTEISRLYFRDPWISVNAKRIEDLGAARIAEQLINYMWGEINLKREVKLAMMDALICGHGWIKVGYTAEFGTVESKPPTKKRGRPKKADSQLDTNEYVKSENVFAYHVPYTQVAFDPSATWPVTHNARWMAVSTIKPLSVVQSSPLYKKEVTTTLTATEIPDKDKNVYGSEGKWVKIWEIWDREHQVVKTLAQGSKLFLKDEMPWPYDFDGYPLVQFGFNPVPNEAYPISDIAPWEGQVVELAKMHSIMMNHLKRWNRQIMIKAGMMTDEEKTKFKNSVDGGIVEYQGMKDDMFVPPYAAVQQDIYGVWNLTMDIARNVMGQSETDRGATAKSTTRTLGELRMQMQGGKSRSDEKLDMVEESISEIARKLLSIMQKKFDLPKIIRIVGSKAMEKAMVENRPSAGGDLAKSAYMGEENGKVTSFSVTKDDIHGELDVDTVAGSTIPLDKENQLEIMEKLTPSLELLGIKPGSKAAIAYGREVFRLINIMALDRVVDIAEEEAANPQPDPEMQKAQMEMQSDQQKSQMDMQAKQQKAQLDSQGQQQKLQMEKEKTQLEMQALQAKVQAEMVKAKISEQKSQMDMQMHLIKSMLGPQNGDQNGHSEKPQSGSQPNG